MATKDLIAIQPSYEDGVLIWDGQSLDDKHIITVVENPASDDGFKIVTLKPHEDNQNFELRIIAATIPPRDFLDRWRFASLPAHLESFDHTYVLVSTKSGTGLASSFWEKVLQPVLELVGLSAQSVTLVTTESADSVKEFAKSTLLPRASQGKKETVILLSGDGAIVDAVNAIEQEGVRSSEYVSPVVALFPLGTGNALFHSLHRFSGDSSIYVKALRTLILGSPKTLPIFQATFSRGARLLTNEGQTASPLTNNSLFGVVVASYGLHATLVADSDTTEWRKHGDKRFGLVAQNLLSPPDGGSPHAYRAKVTLRKGGEHPVARDEHGYVLWTLVSNLEKTFTISPESTPLDGIPRVVHFGPLGGKEVMEIMGGAYQGGQHVQREEVGYGAVEGIKIQAQEPGSEWTWRRFCIDGSIVAVEEGGWIDVSMADGEILQVVVDGTSDSLPK